jgi:hypothetical protein
MRSITALLVIGFALLPGSGFSAVLFDVDFQGPDFVINAGIPTGPKTTGVTSDRPTFANTPGAAFPFTHRTNNSAGGQIFPTGNTNNKYGALLDTYFAHISQMDFLGTSGDAASSGSANVSFIGRMTSGGTGYKRLHFLDAANQVILQVLFNHNGSAAFIPYATPNVAGTLTPIVTAPNVANDFTVEIELLQLGLTSTANITFNSAALPQAVVPLPALSSFSGVRFTEQPNDAPWIFFDDLLIETIPLAAAVPEPSLLLMVPILVLMARFALRGVKSISQPAQ